MYGFVERRIDEAAARGEFDDLPGAGKPLDLSENPYLAPEWRLAFKILADNHVVPEFVERRRAIEAVHAEMKRLCSEAPRRRDRDYLRLAYREQLDRLAAEIDALNRSLARENQFVRTSLQLPPVDMDEEMRAFERLLRHE
ncbi:MAG: DUF1992 domain-containing protein [Planctomycetes bacterium]|nr:DUF1992 domain-containing protein [Planctomycetota bacterium]